MPGDAKAKTQKRQPASGSLNETVHMEGQTASLSEGAAGDVVALLLETDFDVPSRPHKLIGRDPLLAELQTLLDQNERVLLQGIGGIGKTSRRRR